MDVAAALTDAAVAVADSAYTPKVLSSITEDHQDEYPDGTGVDDSALGMLQAMLKAAVNVDDDDYDRRYTIPTISESISESYGLTGRQTNRQTGRLTVTD